MPDLDATRVGSISTYADEDSPKDHPDDHNEIHGRLQGGFTGVTFVIGTEATNVINVGLQLEGILADTDFVSTFTCYLSDDAAGVGVSAAAPSAGIAIGTDGLVIASITANLVLLVESEADGDIDFDIEEVSTGTWYLVVLLPGGGKIVSGAITFA